MSTPSEDLHADLVVIGAGAAGASCALTAARAGLSVILLTGAANLAESNTDDAQGGVVARPPGDTADLLAADIMNAGDGLCEPEAVRQLAGSVPEVIDRFLIGDIGVAFSRDESGELDYTQEAAHSVRRIVHADDLTGHEIATKLLAAVVRESLRPPEADRDPGPGRAGAQGPRIQILTRHTAVDLITTPHHSLDPLTVYGDIECLGAFVLDQESGRMRRIFGTHTVLATGGLGQLYLHTTNPRGARGDGLAMASRAGAHIINAEYVQFHPTAFYHRDAERFLISESVRGEGAVLRDRDGVAFMREYHPDADLAPRDVVARAIHEEMLKTGAEYVLLDLSPLPVDPRTRFPNIYETLRKYGVDITKDPIPVVPAAHYFCGGVKVDLWGRTDVRRLYAVGEVSCTGVHGANRLASTSLLEAVLWGRRAGEDAARDRAALDPAALANIAHWHDEGLTETIDPLLVIQDWTMIKSTMWTYAGIVRTAKRLDRAVADLSYLEHRVEQFYRETKLTNSLVGLRNGLRAARIIAEAARRNPISRGCHWRAD